MSALVRSSWEARRWHRCQLHCCCLVFRNSQHYWRTVHLDCKRERLASYKPFHRLGKFWMHLCGIFGLIIRQVPKKVPRRDNHYGVRQLASELSSVPVKLLWISLAVCWLDFRKPSFVGRLCRHAGLHVATAQIQVVRALQFWRHQERHYRVNQRSGEKVWLLLVESIHAATRNYVALLSGFSAARPALWHHNHNVCCDLDSVDLLVADDIGGNEGFRECCAACARP